MPPGLQTGATVHKMSPLMQQLPLNSIHWGIVRIQGMTAHRLCDGTAGGTVSPDHAHSYRTITPQGVLPPRLRDQYRTGLIWVLKRDQMRPVAVTAICCGNDTCRIL